jgi:LPS O-antigen subunit length determinant protein (WzzB/FepE family)
VNSSKHVHTDEDYEFDVVDLCRVAWAYKRLVASTSLVGALIALVLAVTAVPSYRAEVVVTLVEDTDLGSGQSLASQFGGLASLAGVTLGAGGSHREEHQAVLESRHLIEEFVKRNGVLPLLQGKAPRPPTLWIAVEKFKRNALKIEEDKLKGTTIVSIESPDPVIAARWANAFVALANELVRNKARDDASRNVDYLNEQVAKTNVVELQRIIYNLIESETKTLMLANARVEYAFTVVDPAAVPEVRVSPKRTLMVATGLAIGLVLGVLTAWLRNKFARKNAAAGQ